MTLRLLVTFTGRGGGGLQNGKGGHVKFYTYKKRGGGRKRLSTYSNEGGQIRERCPYGMQYISEMDFFPYILFD